MLTENQDLDGEKQNQDRNNQLTVLKSVGRKDSPLGAWSQRGDLTKLSHSLGAPCGRQASPWRGDSPPDLEIRFQQNPAHKCLQRHYSLFQRSEQRRCPSLG